MSEMQSNKNNRSGFIPYIKRESNETNKAESRFNYKSKHEISKLEKDTKDRKIEYSSEDDFVSDGDDFDSCKEPIKISDKRENPNKQENNFIEFLESKYVHRIDSNKSDVKTPKQVKLSTLIEYYKFWCLFNDKESIDCYQHVIIYHLHSKGYGILTLKRNNKRTKYIHGMYLSKIN